MDTKGWRLSADELRGWLDGLLAAGKRVVAPVVEGDLTLFRPVDSADQISLASGKTQWSPKEYLFPKTETLYSYELGPDAPELSDPELPDQEQVLFGVRSCDAAGLSRLDDVFLKGKVVDPFYARRRELSTIVAVHCDEAWPECFCTAVGGSPMGTEGVDVRVVPHEGHWLVIALTAKGKDLINAADSNWSAASTEYWSAAEQQGRRVAESITRKPLGPEAMAALEGAFGDQIWADVSRRCLSCSICAYVCPSCSCFDVNQEGDAWRGREVRSWDACTFPLFTVHASGHNPRQGTEGRYRQRLLHKFSYAGEDEQRVIRCVGCGRCISLCPAGIDIHEAADKVADTLNTGGADG